MKIFSLGIMFFIIFSTNLMSSEYNFEPALIKEVDTNTYPYVDNDYPYEFQIKNENSKTEVKESNNPSYTTIITKYANGNLKSSITMFDNKENFIHKEYSKDGNLKKETLSKK